MSRVNVLGMNHVYFRDMWGSRIEHLVVGEREHAPEKRSGAKSKDLTVSETFSSSNLVPL